MRFEWDETKNGLNIRNHKIDFADVPPVFGGPMLVELDERVEYGEHRWVGVGFLRNAVVVIVFTEPQRDVIRIISARKANKYERQKYEQALKN